MRISTRILRSARALLLMLCGVALVGCDTVGMMALHGTNLLARTGAYTHEGDVVYGPLDRHHLDVYTPTMGEPPYPVVVFIHGGDWSDGYPDKDMYRFVGDALTSRGIVAVVPNYRRFPTARFPDFIEDAAQALVWTYENVEAFGGDPDGIFLMGHSAGAHIGSMVALNDRYLREVGGDRSWIRGFVGMAGPYSFPYMDDNDAFVEVFGAKDAYPRSQPINYVAGDAPPTLLVHGAKDDRVPLETMIRMAQQMDAVGAPAETITYENLCHIMVLGSFAVPVRWGEPVLNDLTAWVNAQYEHPLPVPPQRTASDMALQQDQRNRQ
ncbi:alpha/beta hydrolase [Phycisphaerales bacterium AB-hyl4]|uniref:Alpha/beta hydrolase n=1 Tax=Natronomicrosphaera hydrolytica TaxID=3242702 RepID=A0ABV4U2B2_9BACT